MRGWSSGGALNTYLQPVRSFPSLGRDRSVPAIRVPNSEGHLVVPPRDESRAAGWSFLRRRSLFWAVVDPQQSAVKVACMNDRPLDELQSTPVPARNRSTDLSRAFADGPWRQRAGRRAGRIPRPRWPKTMWPTRRRSWTPRPWAPAWPTSGRFAAEKRPPAGHPHRARRRQRPAGHRPGRLAPSWSTASWREIAERPRSRSAPCSMP